MTENHVDLSKWQDIQKAATDLGFSDIGCAPIEKVADQDVFREWVKKGYHADMKWFEDGLEKRLDPEKVFPKAQSILVLLSPYHQQACSLGGYKLARYATGDDYHDVLKKRLKALCRLIEADFPNADFRVYVDSGPIAERYWAQRAGLGWIGKNGNLINKHRGSYVFIACILTNLTLPASKPHLPHCGTCTACLDNCPTQAIVKPGIVDSRKCISYLTIEHRGPFHQKETLDGWIFGCDVCQEVCPWNRKPTPFANLIEAFGVRESYHQISKQDLEALTEPDFRLLFRKSPIKRTKWAGIQRNLDQLETNKTNSIPSGQ